MSADPEIVRKVAEALEDATLQYLGRDLGTIHWDDIAEAALAVAEPLIRADTVAPFNALFSGGPDTACRTSWDTSLECVQVPLDDLLEAFRVARGGQ